MKVFKAVSVNTTLRVAGLAALLLLGFGVGRATANQPHMQSALDHLMSAKSELEVAEHNKGGHRANALDLVKRAISEVRSGIAAGK